MNALRFIKKMSWIFSITVLGALVLAACQAAPTTTIPVTGYSYPPAASNSMPTATAVTSKPAAPAATEAEINVAMDAKLGNILVGNKGLTLYMFTNDTPDTSNCAGGCLKAWPPLLTQGNPVLGAGVDKSLLGTATLANGSKIVTYNHMPLYYWMKDSKPGDITGLGVAKQWYLVSPDGKVVGK